MLHAHIMGAINEALDSAEFRALLSKILFEKIAPTLPKEPEEKEVTATNGRGLDPSGLAWLYQQKLSRRPMRNEELTDLAAYMVDFIKNDKIPAQFIFDTLHSRGRSAESIFDFCKRLKREFAESKPAESKYNRIEAEMNAELARRNGKVNGNGSH